MAALLGVSSLDAVLVHHTGSMIRVAPRHLALIPATDAACSVLLPDGVVVAGQWHPHPKNPYLAGRELVRWIKSWVPYGKTVPIRLHQIGNQAALRVELLTSAQAPAVPGPFSASTIQKAIRALAQQPRARRRVAYERWERNPSLRSLAMAIWPAECQVRGCQINAGMPAYLIGKLVDVHHLNHVSTGGSDSPLNLALLCVTHHQLVHRAPSSSLTLSSLDGAELKVNGLLLIIDRDLTTLMAALQ